MLLYVIAESDANAQHDFADTLACNYLCTCIVLLMDMVTVGMHCLLAFSGTYNTHAMVSAQRTILKQHMCLTSDLQACNMHFLMSETCAPVQAY